jgi:hypothetical protein
MNYPFASRRIWAAKAKKEQPSEAFVADVLDPTVLQRIRAKDIRPRYQPAPLRPFRTVLREPTAGKPARQPRVSKADPSKPQT